MFTTFNPMKILQKILIQSIEIKCCSYIKWKTAWRDMRSEMMSQHPKILSD